MRRPALNGQFGFQSCSFKGRVHHRSLGRVTSRSQENSEEAHAGERRVVDRYPQNDDSTKLFQLA